MSNKYNRYWKAGVVVAGLLVTTMPVTAHHSIASQYDMTQAVEVTGVIQRIEWVNPHPLVVLEVATETGGKEMWIFQFGGLDRALGGQLRAAPSKGGLAPGQTLTMYGFRAKNGKTQAWLKQLKMPDGRVVVAWFGDPNA